MFGVDARGQWRMPNRVRVLIVPDADRAELERRARSKSAPARVVERARIVLLAAEGLTGAEIAGRAGCTEPTVIKWRRQYAERGLAGLEDAPRGGGPVTVLTEEAVCEILAATVTPPPEALRARGITHWSARRLAGWLRTARKLAVSHDSVIRVWHRFCLQPHRTAGFKFSTDPQLDAKVRDVVGLYWGSTTLPGQPGLSACLPGRPRLGRMSPGCPNLIRRDQSASGRGGAWRGSDR
jgi:transposase